MSLKERFISVSQAIKALILEKKTSLGRLTRSRRTRRLLLGGALVGLLALLLYSGTHRINAGEVGVFINNFSGALDIDADPGFRITLPLVYSFHRLDRRVQSILMADKPEQGFRGGDAIKIKTSDGSSVSLDILATYRMLPEHADQILRNAGRGLAFGKLWVRSSVRAAIAAEFGKLTSEQLYTAETRNRSAAEVVNGLNKRLKPFGIEMVAVVPQDFRFYKEYEEIIRKKKLADQEVEEQQAQARLAQEEQNKKISEAEIKANQKLLRARGEAERMAAEAKGYAAKRRLDAEAALLTTENRAASLLAAGLAEAQGLREEAEAIAGQGGINLVALEYAKKLGGIEFSGVPVVQDGRMGQYRVHSVPAQAANSCAGGVCGGGL